MVGVAMAHIRQSRPDSGLGFHAKFISTFQVASIPLERHVALRGGVAAPVGCRVWVEDVGCRKLEQGEKMLEIPRFVRVYSMRVCINGCGTPCTHEFLRASLSLERHIALHGTVPAPVGCRVWG
jgi:hypothetical protein